MPPIRLSLNAVTTGTGTGGPINSTLTSTYDAQRRLVREVGSGGFTTTYTAWDNEGRPSAGSTVIAGGLVNAVLISYDAATRTQMRNEAGVQCTMTFDRNGNQVGAFCPGSSTTITITATQSICR